MSLHISLLQESPESAPGGIGIFVIDEGNKLREITIEEWSLAFPSLRPINFAPTNEDDPVVIFSSNITHNLNKMADAAGIYQFIWRPEEVDISMAFQLIDPLEEGLMHLVDDPEKYRVFNPENGWGNYDGLVKFVRLYLKACRRHRHAKVQACR